VLPRDVPLAVCDKTAAKLQSIGGETIVLTPSTWFYRGGGCR
jgi:hypothetical protein